ncbi:hypothetical protein FISHEDRAFT_35328 [Fistulina hepatica ATCC 64428]|uniref:Tetraspanin Tsp2 n=1 Tax=Fistulina hepatica ATCC 64428 TaxID=1128425 RepID=A0A0D7ALD3_9AGAR|nr:hypothetical protein FISHEDRAFT_43399 [Fistulina hepatica ATCC 64428]KIY52367.1 hypothetical protein FISHEDRAFT_35328 [Fistulina hepatica ATCC 64428]
MVSRGLSFITFRTFSGDASHGPSRRGTVSSQYTAVSTDCEEPCVDVDSLRTRLSVDGGHLSLIPSVGTTSRFTHKWPRPQSLWALGTLMDPHRPSLSVRDVVRIKQNIAQALEDGEGLGMDRVEKWTPYKWALLLSVISVFVYGLVGLICALMTWFHVWPYADVTTVVDYDVLVLTTLASSMLLLAALLGLTGTLLNSRPILAVYAVLLWPALIATAVIMYVSYRRATFALDRKLSAAWSADLTPLGRLVIQDALRCCGFYGPTHEATPSGRCYPRSPLPGCIGRLLRLERVRLKQTWRTVLGLVPVHVVNMVTATLCANHVTRRFGKGLTPRRYRLSSRDVQADAEKILGQGAVV